MNSHFKKCLGVIIGSVLVLSSSQVTARGVTGTDLLNLLVDNGALEKEKAVDLVNSLRPEQENSDLGTNPSNEDVLALLVEQGLVSQDQADALKERVAKRSEVEESAILDDQTSKDVRIPYIPDYLQKDMEERLKFAVESDLVDAVHDDVVATARVQGWGIKEAPSWVHKVKLSGDGRLRYQGDYFPSDNALYARADISGVNQNGISDPRSIYDNVTDDRHRLRSRFRLAIKAKPFESITLGMRLTTGDEGNPVSSNQTLGSYGAKWDTNMDLGYIHYRAIEKDLELWGGRFESPMLKTDLIFDSDMTFEGLAASYFFLRNDTMYEDYNQWDPYITIGVYPLQEIHQFIISETPSGTPGADANLGFDNGDDKMLYALQLGSSYDFFSRNKLSVALSLYHYENITGKRNEQQNSSLQNVTAAPFYQYGNTIFNIANDPNGQEVLFALASEFSLANATITYRMANFYPAYLDLHADYVKNLAFNSKEIEARIGGNAEVPDRDTGYQLGFSLGSFELKHRYDWRVGFTYRHLEGDAVLDAFADSDFLLGGTDAEGYTLYGQYGLLDNVIGGLKYITADSIDVDPADPLFNISVDTVFMDISARF